MTVILALAAVAATEELDDAVQPVADANDDANDLAKCESEPFEEFEEDHFHIWHVVGG